MLDNDDDDDITTTAGAMGDLPADEPGLRLLFPPLPGEKVLHLGRTADGTIALTDFRLFLHSSTASSKAAAAAAEVSSTAETASASAAVSSSR